MKKTYSRPGLIEYGLVDELTLGSFGTLPDFDLSGNLINVNCLTTGTFLGTDGLTYTRVACGNTQGTLS